MHAVIATAGHVDHGKSTLVRALTGIEPDRLAEERRRGLTIDLGFAWTGLPSGAQLAFVDVPGHERFVANMLAGLGPVPAVLFVVAADGGWSAQSSEHLAAIDALEVRHGLLAVTRSDLADPEPARAEALRRIGASSLGAVPDVAVSGRTGAGLGDLRLALDDLVAALPAPDDDAPVRLWVDRSFSMTGAGTVVTGTLAAGTIAVGDRLEFGARTVTVRTVQSGGETTDRVRGTRRVALNLRGIAAEEIGRGDVLLTPGTWWRSTVFDVRLTTGTETEREPPTRRLPHELVLHAGTAAVPAHVRSLDEQHARLTLARELPLRAGERAVLRDPGRPLAITGVLVLDADPPAFVRRGDVRRRSITLRDYTGPASTGLEIARRGAVARRHLDRLGVDTSGLEDERGWLVDPAARARWVAAVEPALAAWARAHPLDPTMPEGALARELDVPAELLATIVRTAGQRARDGRIGAAQPTLGPQIGALVQRLTSDPFAAPDADELAAIDPRELGAAERGAVLRRLNGLVLLPDADEVAVRRLQGLAQPFTLSDARRALATTRRVAVPLLEHLDAIGRTTRVDSQRRCLVPSNGVW